MVNVYDSVLDSFAIVGVYNNGADVTKDYFNYYDNGRDFMFYPFAALERVVDVLRTKGLEVVIEY